MRSVFSCLILALFAVSGCSYFSFDTNLNPDNIEDYFAKANIKVYKNSELRDLNYESLGTVEGISCQTSSDEPEANERDARIDAREKAHMRRANGIVYTSCVALEDTPVCLTSVSCYARALYVKED